MLFCWYNVLIVFFLYFAAIDSNIIGFEGEEGFEEFEEVQGQISQPRQAIF
jgi:hypothetical protein